MGGGGVAKKTVRPLASPPGGLVLLPAATGGQDHGCKGDKRYELPHLLISSSG